MNLINDDCLIALKKLPDNSVDACVTDPPYELTSGNSKKGFMGKEWDGTGISYNIELWKEVLRVLKPGGHLLSFGGSRTYHRMACAIEDAGFEIRDQIMWIHGQGFPKSKNLKEVLPGFGSALKPAHEPVVLARKPISESTIAKNVMKYGTGGINIDGSRIGTEEELGRKNNSTSTFNHKNTTPNIVGSSLGRFPANIIHDGSEEVVKLFPNSKSSGPGGNGLGKFVGNGIYGKMKPDGINKQSSPDSGSAARFFYAAKVSKAERNMGCEGLEEKLIANPGDVSAGKLQKNAGNGTPNKPLTSKNTHPTVKPLSLMRYLIKLITPPNGTVLDPFMGSGSTGIAAKQLGFNFIGIEKEKDYFIIAQKRIGANTTIELPQKESKKEVVKVKKPTLWDDL